MSEGGEKEREQEGWAERRRKDMSSVEGEKEGKERRTEEDGVKGENGGE